MAEQTQGLSSLEASRRLERDGPNELPTQRPRNLAAIAYEVLTEPMLLLLIAAASIYVVLGDTREALILMSSVLVIIAISIVQERRTERALAALRDLSAPRALVIRDGRETRIPGRDVVVGDLLVLHEGDRVPADAVVRSSVFLSIDESILTGESVSVDKVAGDQDARIYSGTLVVRGYGSAEVTATGERSELGRLGQTLAGDSAEATPLYLEVRSLVRWVAIAAVALCATIALIYTLARGSWLNGVLAGITVAMGILPEEFPVVLTLFLAMGAWRISRVGVLTRRMPAIEAIGAATLLAVDKTGTLTENRMRVALIEAQGSEFDLRAEHGALSDAAGKVLAVSLAASELSAFDPMERAIRDAAAERMPDAVHRREAMTLVKEYDLSADLLAVTHVWKHPDSTDYEVAVKGAPEAVLALCRATLAMRDEVLQRVARYADHGLRVLAVARGTHRSDEMPSTPFEFTLELVGLICLADPLRSDVADAIAQCRQAGIRVVMITGDHPATALAIAGQAGLDTSAGAMTGTEIEALSDEALRARTSRVSIYARAKPEHKLRLVHAFRANGDVVAMTGDGVNDAPALRAAHIGVAMGGRGTDVAREAADLVLEKDDFASLVTAVRLGRRIYSNIRHAMSYLVSVHMPIAAMGLVPVLIGWPLLLHPLHVLFLEFVIDPASAFVFESDPEAADIMKRKPRPRNERLFSRAILERSLWLGAAAIVASIGTYAIALRLFPAAEARALAFLSMVSTNLALIFVSRSRTAEFARVLAKPNPVYWWIVGLTLVALCLAIYVPPIAELFDFARPETIAVLTCVLSSWALVLVCGIALRNK